MRFATPNRVEGPYSGRHRSRSFGGSGEFADFRAYSPGDDLRHLDWRMLSRTGRAYTKRFQEDTNLACLSVIDCSGSMKFNGQPAKHNELSKLEFSQYFVSALTHLVTRGGDQAGLAIVGDGLHDYHAPGSTPTHASTLLSAIEKIKTVEQTDLVGGLESVITRLRGRGVLLLISDFLVMDPASLAAALRRFRHQGWEIVMLHLIHPLEEELPEGVAYQFVGLEGEGSVRCRISEIRELYQSSWQEHLKKCRDVATSLGADYRRISTATSYLDALSQFLVQRAG